VCADLEKAIIRQGLFSSTSSDRQTMSRPCLKVLTRPLQPQWYVLQSSHQHNTFPRTLQPPATVLPATASATSTESEESAVAMTSLTNSSASQLCGGVTVYSALRKSGASSGDWVVIPGAGGGLGHLAVQTAKSMGHRVIGIDHSSKKQLALDSGAEAFFGFDTSGDNLVKDVREVTTGGLGAKAVIVVTASNAAYATAMDMLRFRGTLVCVGIPEGEAVPIAGAKAGQMLQKELRIVGSAVGSRAEAIECLELARRGVVKMHYRVEPKEKLESVFREMEEGKLQGRVVVTLD